MKCKKYITVKKAGVVMTRPESFHEISKNHLKLLAKYIPIVDRVHGPHHPEFREVRRLLDLIVDKVKKAGSIKPNLDQEWNDLRNITHHYSVPNDVCETYEAVYNALEELDKAYYS